MSSTDVQRGSSPVESSHPTAANGHTFGPGRSLRQGTKVLPEHARGHNRSLVLQTTVQHFEIAKPSLHDLFVRIAKPTEEDLRIAGEGAA